jgi:hypothetical protein
MFAKIYVLRFISVASRTVIIEAESGIVIVRTFGGDTHTCPDWNFALPVTIR